MITGILLAAGSASRMGFDKLSVPIGGRTAIERSADLLVKGGCEKLVIVTSAEHFDQIRSLSCPVPVVAVPGGKTRGDSVIKGLEAASGCTVAVIHDAARCFVPVSCVKESIESAKQYGSGVLAIPVADTVVRTDGETYETVDRKNLYRTQTPQTFRYDEILSAYRHYDGTSTDDADLYRKRIGLPRFVPGSELARKLTSPEDWKWAKELCMMCTKIGIGFDTHRLVEGRDLILGGVKIPYEKGLLGHSDADVLIHAIIDAILGAAALGDIGKLFPDSDPDYKGIDSRVLLRETVKLVRNRDMCVEQIDTVILCQRPKLRDHIDSMRANLALDLEIPLENVSVKATTTEGMNDEGKGLCISAQAICRLRSA